MIELTPLLDSKSNKALYIQLADYIKQEILTGRMKPNEKLPSKRKLSDHLGISLNTVQSAYDQLSSEGYVISEPRKGLFVTKMEDDIHINRVVTNYTESIKNQTQEVKIDFNSGKVDLDSFPYTIWRKLTMQSLYEDRGELLHIGDPQGELLLREQIASHLYTSRGVRCNANQIIIGAGTQVLIGLLHLIIGSDRIYGIENPGFHRTRITLEHRGAETVSIPLDEEGISVKALRNTKANVVYVTPSHQFPYGMILPISKRMELLKWAEETNSYIIEDDYDGEYRYKGKPIPSLQGLDSNESVIYLGTFSKSLIPSIRLSYIVLPSLLLKNYQDHFTIYKQTVSRLHQETLYRFMKEGHWQTHLNKMRTLYRKKHKTLLNAIDHYLGEKVQVVGEKSGLHIILEVKNKMKEQELINKAMDVGIKVYPYSIYYYGKMNCFPKILVGYGGLSEIEIKSGIRLLSKAWQN
ncbi:PLP-dependent aminotransferase family protein [Aquibacillus koreensis]|uniref:PLP-dependent aminotransferase family protein n=1 Tax=Aquibacillus koreensis TaxID=279446 RepID=A0A9X4AJN5_9BACI|nr:PLP-dependent aminotransferase family protein [Aquibacillus koreensis]MCT2536864.1 PLP-dependent aminotransferase family protein [Aquibacillus koreensis]MDC3422004.1 PLP-dependent aminotransferase family protein [Aquibacillus koreensis]